MRYAFVSALAVVPAAIACQGSDAMPSASGSEVFSEPRYIGPGEVFDGNLVRYDRGVPCSGQSEGGKYISSSTSVQCDILIFS
jgi:pectate lyase